jgi:hypothetical protein
MTTVRPHLLLPTFVLVALLALVAFPELALAADPAPPAGGAAIDQVVIATVGAMVVTTGVLLLGIGHRTGRIGLLSWGAGISERLSGLPGWAALPAALITVSLVTALFGMLWDISLHIDDGRDEGPLANPAHYFILIGLFGIFASGFIAMVLPKGRPSASAIRIAGDWYAPLGGVLIAACGAFSLVAFPLDDVWHRLFGQDVTLWGPTHLMLIGGAAMTLLGTAVLLVEGERANVGRPDRVELTWVIWLRRVALTGGFLLGLSTFQGEFDFGVPQFRLVFHPMLIMLAAGGALVAARVWLGRGAALGAVAFFLAVRGVIALLVGPVLGEATPHFPPYVVEAVVIELVALRVAPRRSPLAFATVSGALMGTIGLAAEWGWTHVFFPNPWPAELLPEGAILGFAMAIAGALIGAWLGARLASDDMPRTRSLRVAGAAGALAVAALVAVALPKPADSGISARVVLEEASPPPERTVNATVRLQPPDAADDAEWLTALGWQGGGLVVNDLDEVGPGAYRTTEPIPVYGDWKAIIRLHDGNSLTALPVYLPEDPAIPAEEVPASRAFTREFVPDEEIVQRELKDDVPGALTTIAYAVVLVITLGFLALLAWGLHRLAVVAEGPPSRDGRATASAGTDRRPRVAGPVPAS